MKYILILLLTIPLIVVCQKTSYENKCDEIQKELYTRIGVDSDLIQLAISSNNWDVVGYSEELSYKSKLIEKSVLLALLFKAGEELELAENLKTNVDYKRINDKNNAIYYKYSDYNKLEKTIFRKFYWWLEQGEFEIQEDYNKRILSRSASFDSICEDELVSRLKKKVSDELRIELEKFNTNEMYFNAVFNHQVTKESITGKVYFSTIEEAQKFKELMNSAYYRLDEVIPIKVNEWIRIGNNFFPTVILGNSIKYKHDKALIIIKSNDLKISTILSKNLKYDNLKKTRIAQAQKLVLENKIKKLLDESDNLLKNELFKQAESKYQELLIIDSLNNEGLKGLKFIDSIYREKEREILIKNADGFIKSFNYYAAFNSYSKALEIRNSENLTRAIENCKFELSKFEENKHHIDSLYTFYKNNKELKPNGYYTTKANNVKQGYGNKYLEIIQYLNEHYILPKGERLSEKTCQLLRDNSSYWSIKHDKTREDLIAKVSQINYSLSVIEKIHTIIQTGSRKEMKILKLENLETLINSL